MTVVVAFAIIDLLPLGVFLTVSEPVERIDMSVTGLLAKLLSGQSRPAGTRHDAAPESVDRSNEGHHGHTLT